MCLLNHLLQHNNNRKKINGEKRKFKAFRNREGRNLTLNGPFCNNVFHMVNSSLGDSQRLLRTLTKIL